MYIWTPGWLYLNEKEVHKFAHTKDPRQIVAISRGLACLCSQNTSPRTRLPATEHMSQCYGYGIGHLMCVYNTSRAPMRPNRALRLWKGIINNHQNCGSWCHPKGLNTTVTTYQPHMSLTNYPDHSSRHWKKSTYHMQHMPPVCRQLYLFIK